MKKLTITIIINITLIVVIISAALIYLYNNPSFETFEKRELAKLNKTCPRMMEPDIRLDRAEILPGNIFQYHFTLIEALKDSMKIDEFNRQMDYLILKHVRTNPNLAKFREHKVTMSYIYSDKKGTYVTQIDVPANRYEH